MKKLSHIKKYLFVFCVLSLAIPNIASGATVYLESSREIVSVGDTFVVTAKINADSEIINTVEGDISITNNGDVVSIQEFSLANSAFGIWPRTPSLSANKDRISFVGGVPGGFSIEGATLFSVVVRAEKSGEVRFTPQGISAYLNDGSGTKAEVSQKAATVTVKSAQGANTQDDWSVVVTEDSIPPEDFIIVLGQDGSLFEGKKFAFFSAVDNQSGIDHYEVSENGQAPVRSGSTYVLQDQSDNVKLRVVAIDKAGNTKTANLPTSDNKPISWVSIIVVLVLILGIRFVYRKWKQKKNIVTNV